jgi:hypothetical protein
MMAMFKTKIPTTREVLPELDEAIKIRERIQEECRSLKIEAAKLRSDISRGTSNDGRNLRVEAVISGIAPPKTEGDAARLDAMLRRIADLEAASEAQWRKIGALEMRASAAICERVRPEHDKLASAICAKLLEAHEMNVQLVALINDVEGQGASTTSLAKLDLNRVLGHPRDRHSGFGYMLREAAQLGHIAAKSVPEALR